jgi:hypothetical protein
MLIPYSLSRRFSLRHGFRYFHWIATAFWDSLRRKGYVDFANIIYHSSQIEFAVSRTDCRSMFFKVRIVSRNYLESILISWDKEREGAKDMREAEGMNRADVEITVITWLNVVPQPAFDFLHRRVRVRNATHRSRRTPDLVDGPRQF